MHGAKMSRIKVLLRPFRWWDSWGDHFSREKVVVEAGAVLEIGPGNCRTNGVVTLDVSEALAPDILHDINTFPWPIEDSSFNAILMFSVIEHVLEPIKVLQECHRILADRGKIYILTPHFSSASSFIDPTHTQHFSGRSFDYLAEETDLNRNYGFYSAARFVLVRRIMSLAGVLNYVPFLSWICNRYLSAWEDYFCYVIRGAGVYFELEKSAAKKLNE